MATREEAIKELRRREAVVELERRGAGEQPQTSPSEQAASQDTFISRVGEDITERVETGEEIKASVKSGDVGLARGTFQFVSNVGAGTISDLVQEGTVSAFRALPDFLEDPIRQAGAAVIDNPIGRAGLSALEAGGELWKEFETNNPEIAKDVTGIGNIINLAAMANPKGTFKLSRGVAKETGKTLVKPLVGTTKAVKKLTTGIAARSSDDLIEAGKQIKNKASSLYDQLDEAGAIINNNKAKSIGRKVEAAVQKAARGELDPELNKSTIARLKRLREVADEGDVTLTKLDQQRQLLGESVKRNTDSLTKAVNSDGRLAQVAIDAIDDEIEGLQKINIRGGGTEAVELLKNARGEWGKFKRFERISIVLDKAGGDPNKIRAAFKRFGLDKRNLRGFNESEVKIIKSIGNPGKSDQILKGIGRFGLDTNNVFLPIVGGSIAAGAGSGGLGATVVAAGTIARPIRKALTKAEPESLLRLIEKGGL